MKGKILLFFVYSVLTFAEGMHGPSTSNVPNTNEIIGNFVRKIDFKKLPIKVSEKDQETILKLMALTTDHLIKFDNNQGLLDKMESYLSGCGEKRTATLSLSSIFNLRSSVKTCTVNLSQGSIVKVLEELHSLKRDHEFESTLKDFTENVFPRLLTQIQNVMPKGEEVPDTKKLLDLLKQINSIAVATQKAVNQVAYRPGYLIASNFMQKLLENELEKPTPQNWELAGKIIDTYLATLPFNPDDATINPLSFKPNSPFYDPVYGPSEHGAPYWIMIAASTLRLSHEDKDTMDMRPFALSQFSSMLKQIDNENEKDKDTIKKAITLLEKNYEKLMRLEDNVLKK